MKKKIPIEKEREEKLFESLKQFAIAIPKEPTEEFVTQWWDKFVPPKQREQLPILKKHPEESYYWWFFCLVFILSNVSLKEFIKLYPADSLITLYQMSHEYRWKEREQAFLMLRISKNLDHYSLQIKDILSINQEIGKTALVKALKVLESIEINDLEPGEAIKFIEMANKLSRTAYGLPENINGNINLNVDVENNKNKDIEEKLEQYKKYFSNIIDVKPVERLDE